MRTVADDLLCCFQLSHFWFPLFCGVCALHICRYVQEICKLGWSVT